MKTSDCIIVGWDSEHGEDKAVLVVGRRTEGTLTIINAFQGEEAKELYAKLITKVSK